MSAINKAVKHLLKLHGGVESQGHIKAIESEESAVKAETHSPIPEKMLTPMKAAEPIAPSTPTPVATVKA